MGRGIAWLFFGAFALAGLALGAMACVALWRFVDAMSWESTAATVIELRVDEKQTSEGTTHRLHCRYRYQVGARTYQSDREGVIEIGGGRSEASIRDAHRRYFRQNEAGRLVCFYDPRDPADAVLDRSLPAGMVGVMLLFLLSHGSVGVAGVSYLWRSDRPRTLQDGTTGLSSDHASGRRMALSIRWLHGIAAVLGLIVASIGAAGGQWGSIVPLLVAALAGAIAWGCHHYLIHRHRMVGALLVGPSSQRSGRPLTLVLPGRWDGAVDLETRWSLPPEDPQQRNVQGRHGPAIAVTAAAAVDASGDPAERRIEFVQPPLPESIGGRPAVMTLEITGRIGNQGYRDSFTVPA